MMGSIVGQLVGLAGALAVTVGPLGALLALLNRRDRRRAALVDRVGAALPSVLVRSDLEIEVGAALLSRGGWVHVGLGPSSPSQTGAVITRLRRALPREVRLAVDGRLWGPEPARVIVESLPTPSSLRPAA